MRFWCHNPVVLRCTIVGRAIIEQRVMLPKFHSDSLLITNPCFVGHSWVGLSFPIDMCRAGVSKDAWYL
jgi:hypothetical protein